MTLRKASLLLLLVLVLATNGCTPNSDPAPVKTEYADLVSFFGEWREFHAPTLLEGIPDYSATAMELRHQTLPEWQARLAAFDTTGWPISHQVDWYLIWAEMNGLDFAHRVKRPWKRDPAFYVWFHPSPTDVPEREGPSVHGAIELPDYDWPLSSEDAAHIAMELRKAPAVFSQARTNLTGNARDLWVTGIGSIRAQSSDLARFARRVQTDHPDLAAAAEEARMASDDFALWLTEQADTKTGASGTGKQNYTWNLQMVHLLPYTWEDEEVLLRRELARAHTSLRLEEHRNRDLPAHSQIQTAEEYDRRLNATVDDYMDFLEEQQILPVKDYMESALREKIGSFSRAGEGEIRGFFSEMTYRIPMIMRTHHYHWIELARMREEPNESPIRRVPLMYNIFDQRAEGLATGMEEMMMHAGLFDDIPRGKEVVWVMLAQRAARALGGLYQHGLEMSLDESTQFASRWVPWGVLPADGATIQWEEQFYLRQPAYGTSYVIGKIEIERLIAEYARQRESRFELSEFMDDFNRAGVIPISLVHWELTGDKSMLLKAIGQE